MLFFSTYLRQIPVLPFEVVDQGGEEGQREQVQTLAQLVTKADADTLNRHWDHNQREQEDGDEARDACCVLPKQMEIALLKPISYPQ